MKKVLASLLLLCGFAVAQQDINIGQIGPYLVLATNATWAGTGVGTLNNNYIFTPSTPNVGVCLYVQNFDSSLKTFTIDVFTSGDQTVTKYNGNTAAWSIVYGGHGVLSSVAATAIEPYFIKLAGAARAMINIAQSGGTSTGTGSLFLVQTDQGGCGALPFVRSIPTRNFATSAFLGQNSYGSVACVTNPGAGDLILGINRSANPVQSVYLDKLRLSSTTAGEIDFDYESTLGTSCTNAVIANSTVAAGVSSIGVQTETSSCVAAPTPGTAIFKEQVGASSPIEIDLDGFWSTGTSASSAQWEVTTPASITGTVCASVRWVETY